MAVRCQERKWVFFVCVTTKQMLIMKIINMAN